MRAKNTLSLLFGCPFGHDVSDLRGRDWQIWRDTGLVKAHDLLRMIDEVLLGAKEPS